MVDKFFEKWKCWSKFHTQINHLKKKEKKASNYLFFDKICWQDLLVQSTRWRLYADEKKNKNIRL